MGKHVDTLPSWSVQLREQIQARPSSPWLLLALAAVLLLLVQSLVVLAAGDITAGMRYGLIGGAASLPPRRSAPCRPCSCGPFPNGWKTPCWVLPPA